MLIRWSARECCPLASLLTEHRISLERYGEMKFTAFLIKYAEIGIKGRNRYLFEDALVHQIKFALKKCEGNS